MSNLENNSRRDSDSLKDGITIDKFRNVFYTALT